MQKKVIENKWYQSFSVDTFRELMFQAARIDLSGFASLYEIITHFGGNYDSHKTMTLIIVCNTNDLIELAKYSSLTVAHHNEQGFICIATASRDTFKKLGYDV